MELPIRQHIYQNLIIRHKQEKIDRHNSSTNHVDLHNRIMTTFLSTIMLGLDIVIEKTKKKQPKSLFDITSVKIKKCVYDNNESVLSLPLPSLICVQVIRAGREK